MDTKAKKIVNNILMGFGGQFIILVIGIVLPRLVLISFGSDMNGLLFTVSQIFTYVTLLEAGIGNASVNALYKPLSENNRSSISEVLSATNKYYKRCSKFYLICVLLIAVIYPFVTNTEINKITVGLVVLFQGLSGVVTFYSVATYKQLLVADGKNYVISNINLFVYILSSSTKIILIYIGFNIILIQIAFFLINCVQILSLLIYCHKKYPWLILVKKFNQKLLSQRRAFMVHEISNVVFSSTDILILSIFCNMKVASVYAIYNLVFSSLNSFIGTMNNGLGFVLGQTFHQNKNKYIRLHDAYDSYYTAFVFGIMSVAYVFILPFIRKYTSGIEDINYIDVYLPMLFCLIQLLSCSRAVSAKLITIAGHASNTKGRSMVEAVINLIVSIVLVNKIGIYGVLLGTIIALIYRTNDIIIYANCKILKRKPIKAYKNLLVNSIVFTLVVYVDSLVDIVNLSYLKLVEYSFIFTVLLLFIYFTVASVINQEAFSLLYKKIKQALRHFIKQKSGEII